MLTFYEFFAGGGMVRAGLGQTWRCLFANDFDPKKGAAYTTNWGQEELRVDDVRSVNPGNLPLLADLAWASFPCQDLSLAGAGAGLDGERSGTFWPFWELMRQLVKEERAPRMVVLENVCGTLTSHGGKDFTAISAALSSSYRFGAVVVDAVNFLPHSRPRLFIIGVNDDISIPEELMGAGPTLPWHTDGLTRAFGFLPDNVRAKWIWWRLPQPSVHRQNFHEIIQDEPQNVEWHSEAETKNLLGMMSAVNIAKVQKAQQCGGRIIGTIYKRTRVNYAGEKAQCAEVRFDNIAGCLRTPTGGSSRQSVLLVNGDKIRSRLLSPREAARLMGLPDDYVLPQKYNEAYQLVGDGVAVPVVRFLAQNILESVLMAAKGTALRAA